MSSDAPEKMTMRYAPYVEERHKKFLKEYVTRTEAVIDDSAYSDYTFIDIDPAFFGAGYVLSSFPSLYDMYGKFMAGLDVDSLFDQLFVDSTTGPLIDNLVTAKAQQLSYDLETEVEPRFFTGMRDINSVMSSSFVYARATIEAKRLQELSKFDSELRYKMIQVATDRWKTHLEWNKIVVGSYIDILKFYITAKIDTDDANYGMLSKDKLWPFTVLDFYRAGIGALQGATTTKGTAGGPSQAQKAISGAMTGAMAGGAIGGAIGGAEVGSTAGPWGTAIGAIVGLAASFL